MPVLAEEIGAGCSELPPRSHPWLQWVGEEKRAGRALAAGNRKGVFARAGAGPAQAPWSWGWGGDPGGRQPLRSGWTCLQCGTERVT